MLDDAARELIRQAPTFFVASCAPSDDGSSLDCDISHRGGKPGFIDVAGNQITVTGFAGNSFFNTLGSLCQIPRAGLLFVDSVIGDVVVLQGTIELLWNDPSIRGFKGAERMAALCHSWPEGAGCGDPSHRRGGRISSAWSRKAITWRPTFVSMACTASPCLASTLRVRSLVVRSARIHFRRTEGERSLGIGRYSQIDRPNRPLWRRCAEVHQLRPAPIGGEKAVELPRPSIWEDQDIVGITNSAPARMPVGQRVVIVFSLV